MEKSGAAVWMLTAHEQPLGEDKLVAHLAPWQELMGSAVGKVDDLSGTDDLSGPGLGLGCPWVSPSKR